MWKIKSYCCPRVGEGFLTIKIGQRDEFWGEAILTWCSSWWRVQSRGSRRFIVKQIYEENSEFVASLVALHTGRRWAVEKCTKEDQEHRWMEVGFRTPFSFPYLEVLLVLVSVANINSVLLYFIHIYLKLVGGGCFQGSWGGHWHLRFSCISFVFYSYF